MHVATESRNASQCFPVHVHVLGCAPDWVLSALRSHYCTACRTRGCGSLSKSYQTAGARIQRVQSAFLDFGSILLVLDEFCNSGYCQSAEAPYFILSYKIIAALWLCSKNSNRTIYDGLAAIKILKQRNSNVCTLKYICSKVNKRLIAAECIANDHYRQLYLLHHEAGFMLIMLDLGHVSCVE